ncbi:MAG: hypothetical protein IJT41_13315 [Clostridia bacterium]|nr:hypothetical protein [Clostridia bacterium]
MEKLRERLSRILFLFVCIVSVALIGISLLPRVFGYIPCSVHDDSMQADYPPGALVLAKPVAFSQIAVEDVLVFQDPDTGGCFVRMVRAFMPNEYLVTAPALDVSVDPMASPYKSVVGRAMRCIPFLGYPSIWLHTLWGKAILALLYIIWIAVEIEVRSASKRRETPT